MKKGERRQRSQQLEIAKRAVDALQEKLQLIHRNAKNCAALSNHLKGFYEEIDKLAKGKTLVPVTDLVVQEANDIVRDAKALITGDTYLDRVKEFVPAGDNPVYPDVLLSIRAVRQSLERAETNSDDRQQYLANLLREARTIRAALEFLIEQDDIPLKEHVEEMMDNEAVSHSWFYESEEAEHCFDFDRLDRKDLEQYLSDHQDQSEARYDAEPEKEPEEEEQDTLEREDDIPEDEA